MTPGTALVMISALAFGADMTAPAPAKVPLRRSSQMAFELKSPAWKAGGFIPKKHSCQGQDVSPALAWTGVPQGTKSFALIMDDPDAPVGTWVHWVVYDLPPASAGLPEGLAKRESLPDGSKQGLCWGVEDFDRFGYAGPCPPPGQTHRYSFRLYALDQLLGLPPKASKAEVLEAMKGRVLGQAELTGLYKR